MGPGALGQGWLCLQSAPTLMCAFAERSPKSTGFGGFWRFASRLVPACIACNARSSMEWCGVVAPVARLPLVAQCPNLPPHFEALVFK